MDRILLVDSDREFGAQLTEEAEKTSSFRVVKTCTNAHDAQSIFNNGVAQYDGVILDLSLPESADSTDVEQNAGLRLIRFLRHEKRYVGILAVLTESCSFADGRMAFESGCDAYLNKGASRAELVASLSFCIEKQLIVICQEMRHLFLPEQVSDKEARLMDLLLEGAKWPTIASSLGYKNAHAACSTADRVFDKLLTWHDSAQTGPGSKKVQALALWKARHRGDVVSAQP